ncbi:MAG: YitT family protein [Leeuwenhoekiella sp.]
MNPILTRVVIEVNRRLKTGQMDQDKQLSDYRRAKERRNSSVDFKGGIRNFIYIVLGVFSAAFGFEGFLLTNEFIDGGATGISLLLDVLTDVPFPVLIFLVNIPFIILGYKIIGKRFAIKTTLAILGLGLCIELIHFPNVTNDDLLVAIFGGFFLGAGIGLAIRGGAVIDGTEVLAIFISKRLGTTIGDVIIVINILIFSVAAYLLSIEIALYSMITYISASKTLDFVIEGIEEYIGITIIAVHSEDIREMIVHKLGRGVTIYKGKGGYSKEHDGTDVDIVYTVITRLELSRLQIEIQKIEPKAFIVINSIKDIKGGIVKRRPLKD